MVSHPIDCITDFDSIQTPLIYNIRYEASEREMKKGFVLKRKTLLIEWKKEWKRRMKRFKKRSKKYCPSP